MSGDVLDPALASHPTTAASGQASAAGQTTTSGETTTSGQTPASGETTPAREISAGLEAMYAAFLAGDRDTFDAHLAADVTTWESHLPGPLRTRTELDAYRDRRDAAGARPELVRLDVTQLRVDAWDESGVARYVLVSVTPQGESEEFRVTDVLRRGERGWVIVHHHSERLLP